jgi:hypothetical protein
MIPDPVRYPIVLQHPLLIGKARPLPEYPGYRSRLYVVDDILDLLRTGCLASPEQGFRIVPFRLLPHFLPEVQRRRMPEVKAD